MAETSGMILPIGDWVLHEVCRQIQKWCIHDPEHSSLRVCVNLSARQFAREGLADHVEALLRQSGIESRQLGLEMTESSLIPDMHTALEVLGSLRRLGVSLLMDDFGTGYSSLSYLHSFPIDVIKIDRSFVGRMTEGEQPLQIVRTIIELARVLGMDVVAEGIETCEQYHLLRELGCRFGQGYLFARPLTAGGVTHLVGSAGRNTSGSRPPTQTHEFQFGIMICRSSICGNQAVRWKSNSAQVESLRAVSSIPCSEDIANASAQPAHDFAGLLAALAATKPTELPKWTDDELPQDVATLSYERALRTHARYKTADADCMGPTRNRETQSVRSSVADHHEVRGTCAGRWVT